MPQKSMYIAEAQMDPEQRHILNTALDHSHIVVGCAGSGKSCLALLRINMLSKTTGAAPYYLVTLVRSLVEYLRQELRINGFSGDFNITHKEWTEGRITSWCGTHFNIPEVHRVINRAPNYLLVDECQDLPMEDIRQMRQSAQKAIFLYGDDEQQIMDFTNRAPASITQIGDELNIPTYRLSLNYRLPKKVARFAQEISGNPNLVLHCKNDDGNRPYIIRVPQQDRFALIKKLSDQNHYDEIGIFYRTDEQVREAYRSLSGMVGAANISARYSTNGNQFQYLRHNTKFKVMNVHQAKGQQFEAVFICMEDNVRYDDKLFYVGITRTYHSLYVMYEQRLPDLLRDVPLALYRTALDEPDQPLVQVE